MKKFSKKVIKFYATFKSSQIFCHISKISNFCEKLCVGKYKFWKKKKNFQFSKSSSKNFQKLKLQKTKFLFQKVFTLIEAIEEGIVIFANYKHLEKT